MICGTVPKVFFFFFAWRKVCTLRINIAKAKLCDRTADSMEKKVVAFKCLILLLPLLSGCVWFTGFCTMLCLVQGG
jgi:hypothetical protein